MGNRTTWGTISFSRRTLFIVNGDSNGVASNLEYEMSNGWLWVNYSLKWTWNEVVALLWHLSQAIEVNQEKPVRKTSALAMIWSKYLPNTRQKHFHLSQLTWYKRIHKFILQLHNSLIKNAVYIQILKHSSQILVESNCKEGRVCRTPRFSQFATFHLVQQTIFFKHPLPQSTVHTHPSKKPLNLSQLYKTKCYWMLHQKYFSYFPTAFGYYLCYLKFCFVNRNVYTF
jgi:hypothetical protein